MYTLVYTSQTPCVHPGIYLSDTLGYTPVRAFQILGYTLLEPLRP